MSSEIEILVTGYLFTGKGYRSFESVLLKLLEDAGYEIIIATYRFGSGIDPIIARLRNAAKNGVRVYIVVDSLHDQPDHVRTLLLDVCKKYKNVKLFDFNKITGRHLHAKVIIIDRRIAIVGSANITWGGLVENHEICLMVRGKIAAHIASILDEVISY